MICQIVQNGGYIFLILFLYMIRTNYTQEQHTFTVQEFCSGNELLHNIEPGTPYILNLRSESSYNIKKWFHKTKRICRKEIRTSDSGAHFDISITNINIPSCDNCRCSYFEISALQHRKRFCGHSEDYFSSKNDIVTIDFHPELNRPFNVTLTFTVQRNFYVLTGHTYDASGPHGFVETPYYPNPYPAKYSAEYVLQCDANSNVMLLFLDFQISPQSFIEVYGNNNTHPTRYYGHEFRPPVLVSELNTLNLKFKANDKIDMPGFRAEFSCIKSTDHLYVPNTNCGGFNNRRDGQLSIKTQEKFALYDCVWQIRLPIISSKSYMSVLVVLKHISHKSKLEFINGRNSKSSVVKEINCEVENCSDADQEIVVPGSADLYIRFHGYLDGLSVVNLSYSTYHTENCSVAEFRCKDDRCILSDFQCDGIKQCPDGYDESMCPSTNAESQLPSRPTTDPEKLKEHSMKENIFFLIIFGVAGVILVIVTVICIGNYRKQSIAEQVLPQSINELSDVQPTIYPVNSYGCDNPPSYEDYIKSSDSYPPLLFTRANQHRSLSDCTHCTTNFCTGARVRHFSADSFHASCSSNTDSDITLNIAEDTSYFSQQSPDCNRCNIEINQSFTFDSSNSVRRSYSLDSKLSDLVKKDCHFSLSIVHPACVHVPCGNQQVCHSLPANFKITKTCDSKEPEVNRFASMHFDLSKNCFKNRRFTQSFPLHRSIGSEIVTVVKTRCFSEPCRRISIECSMY